MRPVNFTVSSMIASVLILAAALLPATAQGQLLVSGSTTVGEYTTSGTAINPSFISGVSGGWGIAVSGSNLFVVNGGNGEQISNGSISEYTTSGALVNAALITGLSTPRDVAVSGSDLYVTNQNINTVGKYTISNGQVTSSTPTLISGLNWPTGIAVSGSNLFVANLFGGIGEYTTSGQTVNASLVPGTYGPTYIAISGSTMYVTDWGNGTLGEYTTSGATVNASLVTGLCGPEAIALSGSDLFVVNEGNGTVGEYDTSGNTINADLISGLDYSVGAAVLTPEPGSLALLAIGGITLLARRRNI